MEAMPRDSSRAGRVRSVTSPTPARFTLPMTFLARVLALASVAIIASIWALYRYYTHPWIPMTVPVARDTAAWDAGAGLIEAPEIEVVPH
jgi:hypothetical protein